MGIRVGRLALNEKWSAIGGLLLCLPYFFYSASQPSCGISTEKHRFEARAQKNLRQAPHANRFAQLLDGRQIRRERLPVGELRRAIAPLGVEIIQQARRAALVRILADLE